VRLHDGGERPVPRIAGVVLAAGASRRFGSQKLLAPLDGKPLVRWAVERMTAAPTSSTLVVVGGCDADAVRAALAGLAVRFVVVEEGGGHAGHAGHETNEMSASLHAAVRALSPESPRAAVFALGDQPRVPASAVAGVVHAFRASGAPIVVPVYRGGVRGHPVLFAANLFPELLHVRGDEGARSVIARDRSRVTEVPIDEDAPRDVDEPGDLEGS
jgi:molybdenum cofactor cytidylyltransferase